MSTGTKKESNPNRWAPAAGVLGLILLAVGIRAYRLGAQSVPYDDFNCYGYLNAPDIATYLTIIRHYNPESVPLYYLVQYLWSAVAGVTPERARWLAILLNAATVPLLWAAGRRLFGPPAGWVAALLFALSPLHLWHGQSLRPYPLVMLLAAASLFFLLRGLSPGARRCAAAHVAVTLLLPLAHLFTVWLLPFQMLALAAARRWRWLAAFAAVTVLEGVALFAYMGRMPHMAAAAYDMYRPPDTAGMLFDLAGDDAVIRLGEVLPCGTTWGWMPEGSVETLRGIRPALDWLLPTAYLLVLAGMAALVLSRKKDGLDWRGILALLLAAAGPALLLCVLTFVWRPVMMPRYTMYSTLAFYLLAGGAAARLGRPGRTVLLAALLVPMLAQLALLLPANTRTNWKGAVELVRRDAGPGDLVIAAGMPSPERIFRMHYGGDGLPELRAATGRAMICEETVRHLNAASGEVSVWVVRDLKYSGDGGALLHCLEGAGLVTSCTTFHGHEGLELWRLRYSGRLADDACAGCAAPVEGYAGMLREAGVAVSTPEQEAGFIRELQYMLDAPSPPDKLGYAIIALMLSEEGSCELAEAFARASLRLAPEYGWGHFALGAALLGAGRPDEARAAFGKAWPDEPFLRLFRPLAEMRCASRETTPEMLSEVSRLRSMGIEVMLAPKPAPAG